MTRIIAAPPAGTLNIKGVGAGFPASHDQASDVGDGQTNINRTMYYLLRIQGNTVANSSGVRSWLSENVALAIPWKFPIAFTNIQVLTRILENQSAVCLGMIGGLAGFLGAAPFNQWSTDVSRKRCGLLVERDGSGVIVWRLSWSNGVAQGSKPILAIPDMSFVSLIYNPNPKTFQVFVDGNLWDGTADANLPDGVQTDALLFSIGNLKKIASANEVSLRTYAPAIMSALSVS